MSSARFFSSIHVKMDESRVGLPASEEASEWRQALRSLDKVLLLFAFVIVFFISLSVFGVDVGDSLTSVYTLGIAASFIFKQTCANMFDAIMFLFVTQ